MKNIIILFVGLLFVGCHTLTKVSNQNISFLYQNDIIPLTPEYAIFHKSDSISTFYYKLNTAELFYTKKGSDTINTAQYSISLMLFPSYESKMIIDSFTVHMTDTFSVKHRNIIGSLDLKTKINFKYLLQVILIDKKRNNKKISYIEIDKTTKNNRQNFLVLKNNIIPNFTYNIIRNQTYNIIHSDTTIKSMYVYCYRQEFPVAAPPFSIINSSTLLVKPDSIFVIYRNEKHMFDFKVLDKGLYHIKADTTQKEGLTLFSFDDDYPDITSVEQLIAPIRYLTTKAEYNKIALSKDKKKSIDDFWIENAGNPLRAKELIRLYYSKVRDANKYFTSYIEGWKTDRGMIYIMYGPPNIVYRSSFSEIWIYGEANNMLSLSFSFEKVQNLFTDNDYQLVRSTFYTNSWYMAVDAWRR
jgi:GWxTD domain-containing protein